MVSIKISELRKKSLDELDTDLESLSKEKFNLRFQKSNGQIKNTGRIKEVRRGLARIKTLKNEKNKSR